jgi:3-hydroxy-9,10-secoandrosta-1,3,5(10)-triene-9,17-dione monooxygenase reductase component
LSSDHAKSSSYLGLHLNPAEFRKSCGAFATGVAVAAVMGRDGKPHGLTINSFTSVSLEPPLLLWCLANTSLNLEVFAKDTPFAVHVLSHDQRDLAMHFARKGRAKFEVDRHWRENPHPPMIADALCRFDCRVHATHPTGDHLVVVGEVVALSRRSGSPLTFHAGRFGAIHHDRGGGHIDPWGGLEGEWI